MSNAAFGKTMENVRKHRNIKLSNRKKKELLRAKSSYYKDFHRPSISNRNEKTLILLNKTVYLGLSILQLRKNCGIWIQTVSLYT